MSQARSEGERYRPELAEAIAELNTDGFISISGNLSSRLPSFRPTEDLYAAFDLVAIGSDPVADSILLTEDVLAGGSSVSVSKLFADKGWGRRRFNPAIALVAAQVDEGRVSRTNDPEFPTRSFHLMDEDRVALKRYLARLRS